MGKVQKTLCLCIGLLIHEHQQIISQPKNLLSCVSEGTTGLRLRDRRHFNICQNIGTGQIDPLGAVTNGDLILCLQIFSEFVFHIGTDGLAIRNPKKIGVRIVRLYLTKVFRFFCQGAKRQLWFYHRDLLTFKNQWLTKTIP